MVHIDHDHARPRTTAELHVSPSSVKAITGTPNSRKPAT
jgi:hypothetical protein